jgi:hypothetical protein
MALQQQPARRGRNPYGQQTVVGRARGAAAPRRGQPVVWRAPLARPPLRRCHMRTLLLPLLSRRLSLTLLPALLALAPCLSRLLLSRGSARVGSAPVPGSPPCSTPAAVRTPIAHHHTSSLAMVVNRQNRSETCDVEEQEPFWCAMNLPPISLADLLRASRASVSDGDHRMATSTSTTMTTTTSTARTSRRLITAPPAGFVGCDLGAFFRSEVEPSPASRSSPPPDLFALPRDSVQMTASSPIRQVPFILMARLKSGTSTLRFGHCPCGHTTHASPLRQCFCAPRDRSAQGRRFVPGGQKRLPGLRDARAGPIRRWPNYSDLQRQLHPHPHATVVA